MTTLLSVVLVALASFGLAAGTVLQHKRVNSVNSTRRTKSLTMKQLGTLLRDIRWVLGLVLIIASTSLHILALSFAPLSVVQPIGILAVPWSVLLAMKIYGHQPSTAVWISVFTTIAGVVGFTLIAVRAPGSGTIELDAGLIGVVFAVGCGIAACVGTLSSVAGRASRSLMLAVSGAILFGLTSALMRTLFLLWQSDTTVFSASAFAIALGVLGTSVVGGWLVQQAHASGQAEVVVGALTTIDPVVAVAYGLIALNEGAGISSIGMLGLTSFGAIAALGVVGLSRYHPNAQRPSSSLHRRLASLPEKPAVVGQDRR
ncbi:DMT family protein [Brevibacterium aurantiacum]|nr:hypothetical protein [Brevibacterium aurantiacum]